MTFYTVGENNSDDLDGFLDLANTLNGSAGAAESAAADSGEADADAAAASDAEAGADGAAAGDGAEAADGAAGAGKGKGRKGGE